MLAILPVLSMLKKVLTFVIPIPIWVILLVGIWFHFDKASAIKTALAELVAGAELQARDAVIRTKEQQLAVQKAANERQNLRIKSIEAANSNFKNQLTNISTNNNKLKEQLNEIVTNSSCDGVSDEFLKLLQSNQ